MNRSLNFNQITKKTKNMKKTITSIISVCSVGMAFAQPVLYGDSLHSGQTFNLYSLSNVSTSSLILSGGANLTWDLTTSTATQIGTADFLDMSATPYAAQYPAANFAIKLTSGLNSQYSLFNRTSTILEEVANNVGTNNPTTFINYRTALVFPFTYNLSNTDTYQKSGQNTKSITNHYDAYGTLETSIGTFNNVIRNLYDDDGNTSANCWTTSMIPVFQANSNGYTLWKMASSTTGVTEMYSNNLFDMYPNPAANELNIINKELISKIEIFNATGQLQFSTSRSTIDISELPAGVYILKAYSAKGVGVERFIRK
jgi:hypothetical protein